LGRFKQSLGVLAAATLVVAGVSAGTASAATHPIANKAQWQAAISHVQQPGNGCYNASYPSLQWHAVKCIAAPRLPLAPTPRSADHGGPATVGDGHDYSAKVTGLISKAIGTFTHVSSNVSVKGAIGGTGAKVANGFSLQLNTQFFTGSPTCKGSSCQAWQQFVYTYKGCGSTAAPVSCLFMQYWLINYSGTCPSGWFTYSSDCYTNSNAVKVTAITAKELGTTKLTATAKTGGSDVASLAVGSGKATSVSNADTKIHLAAHWNTTEWGLFGDGGGGEATFGADNTIQPQTAITDSAGAKAPTCVSEGFTGETNNLKLAHTAALGTVASPTMASNQTDGTSGTASCAVKA
jgi:hypothetical protein